MSFQLHLHSSAIPPYLPSLLTHPLSTPTPTVCFPPNIFITSSSFVDPSISPSPPRLLTIINGIVFFFFIVLSSSNWPFCNLASLWLTVTGWKVSGSRLHQVRARLLVAESFFATVWIHFMFDNGLSFCCVFIQEIGFILFKTLLATVCFFV